MGMQIQEKVDLTLYNEFLNEFPRDILGYERGSKNGHSPFNSIMNGLENSPKEFEGEPTLAGLFLDVSKGIKQEKYSESSSFDDYNSLIVHYNQEWCGKISGKHIVNASSLVKNLIDNGANDTKAKEVVYALWVGHIMAHNSDFEKDQQIISDDLLNRSLSKITCFVQKKGLVLDYSQSNAGRLKFYKKELDEMSLNYFAINQ
ncbi:MAG: hypothetical protein GOU98_00975 [Candidatus Altiarchaeota archaeon]|nr:hypothetical protein [Candidatus Altiarchaeota archaeon]